MRPARPSRPMIVGAVVACLLLAGCATSSDNEGDGQRATNSTIDTFAYGLEAIPGTLDVANNYDAPSMSVMGLVTQPLEIPNLDGTFTPVLAESVAQPDDLTLVYDLRSDVTFSDGSPLSPEDVVWTIAHLRGDATHTVSELTNLKTVKVTGEHQVTITLSKPNPAQRGAFAIISFIQQKKYGESSGDDLGTPAAPPVGTGPYVVDSFTSSGITLTRNPEFWGTDPAVDKVEVTAISDDNAAQLAMRSGALDGFQLLDVKTAGVWKKVPGATTYSSATLYLDYVTMNTAVAPFDDVHVRRAVAYATDTEGLLQANYGEQARPNTGLTPPEVLANVEPSEDAFVSEVDSLPSYEFDIEKAKDELAQSGHPDGFTATYQYYSPAGKLVGLSLAQNLSKIGITLDLQSRRLNDFLGDIFVGKFPEIGFSSIAAVVPDPSSWYLYLAAKGNPYNTASFSNDATTTALSRIDSSDSTERWEGVKTMLSELATEVPYVALAQPSFVYALGDGMTFIKTPDFIEVSSGNWVNSLKSTR